MEAADQDVIVQLVDALLAEKLGAKPDQARARALTH
jgi:hypothetical protein